MDETVVLDEPGWLGPVLAAHSRARGPEGLLFTTTGGRTAGVFRSLAAGANLPGLCLYQLRHGGASEDLLSRKRTLQEVKARGHWVTDASLRRYGKPGTVQKILNQMSPALRAMGTSTWAHMQELLEGRWPPSWFPPA